MNFIQKNFIKINLNKNDFIETLKTDEVRRLYERRWCREAMYLVAMIDYLSRTNDVPLCTNYNDIRSQKLEKLYFSAGV